jgi:phosphohistidine phosphatase
MRLYLVRHGVAVDRDDPQCPTDTERPLTPKGMKKTRAAAQGFRALGIAPGAVLTSPWLRAAQTAEIFCEVLGFPLNKIVRTEALKGDSNPSDLFRELAKLRAKEVICFGHEPHLHLVIGAALRTSAVVKELKKSGIALLDLEGISPPRGQLLALYPPKTLRLLAE